MCLLEATVELSLDSPQEKRKRDVAAKPTASASAAAPASSLAAAAGPTKPQPAALEEVISCPVVLLSKMSLLNDDHQKILQVFVQFFTQAPNHVLLFRTI